jgi:hypothetical protein
MQDAQYFRSQAEMYFELAQRMSLHVDSEFFCIQAEHCLARATELESESEQQPARPAH